MTPDKNDSSQDTQQDMAEEAERMQDRLEELDEQIGAAKKAHATPEDVDSGDDEPVAAVAGEEESDDEPAETVRGPE